MNGIGAILEIIKTLIPLFINLMMYKKGSSDKEKELLLETKNDIIKQLKKQNEKILKMKEIDNEKIKTDSDDDIDDLLDRL